MTKLNKRIATTFGIAAAAVTVGMTATACEPKDAAIWKSLANTALTKAGYYDAEFQQMADNGQYQVGEHYSLTYKVPAEGGSKTATVQCDQQPEWFLGAKGQRTCHAPKLSG